MKTIRLLAKYAATGSLLMCVTGCVVEPPPPLPPGAPPPAAAYGPCCYAYYDYPPYYYVPEYYGPPTVLSFGFNDHAGYRPWR